MAGQNWHQKRLDGRDSAMNELEIIPYRADYKAEVLDLTARSWAPVLAKTKADTPGFVYDAFYPHGWQPRQAADVAGLLELEPENIWLAVAGKEVAGFIGLRIHREDQVGEIHIIDVSPEHQRQGIGSQLMRFAENHIRTCGMKMVMVETKGDTGHEPARRAYEAFGFERLPIARYFKQI